MKHLVIVGGAGSGKSRRAELEASKDGGHVVRTSWDEAGRFWLGKVLASNPTTVIVEGFRPGKGRGNTEFLKGLLDSSAYQVPVQGKNSVVVPAPRWIFVVQTPFLPLHRMSEWAQGRDERHSRFELIDMGQDRYRDEIGK